MPKEVKYYVCNICKTQYKDKEKAKACEKQNEMWLNLIRVIRR